MRIWKLLTIRRRAKKRFCELNRSDYLIPMSWTLDLGDKRLLRHFVRLYRITQSKKPFRRIINANITISGTPWESEWYLKYIGARK
jgi:hypothetical protein